MTFQNDAISEINHKLIYQYKFFPPKIKIIPQFCPQFLQTCSAVLNTKGNRKVKSLINYDRYEASKLSYTFKLLQEK